MTGSLRGACLDSRVGFGVAISAMRRLTAADDAPVRLRERKEASSTRSGSWRKISDRSPDGKFVEIAELPDDPWYLAVQFHPEFPSRPLEPHPLFASFIEASHRHKTRQLAGAAAVSRGADRESSQGILARSAPPRRSQNFAGSIERARGCGNGPRSGQLSEGACAGHACPPRDEAVAHRLTHDRRRAAQVRVGHKDEPC